MNPQAIALLFSSNSEIRDIAAQACGPLSPEDVGRLTDAFNRALWRKVTSSTAMEFTEHEICRCDAISADSRGLAR